MRTLALLGVFGFLLLAIDAAALVRCGVTKEDRAFVACPTVPPHVVPDAIFLEDGTIPGGIADGLPPNPAFATTFDVYTCYEYGDSDYWGPEELRLFASYVLRGSLQDAEGLAIRVLDFFAENSPDPSHPVRIDLGSSVMDAFEIHIQAGAAQIGAADNKL